MEYRKFNESYILRLDPGEEVVASIGRLTELEDIVLASVQGIGAADEVTVGIFQTKEKEYQSRTYNGAFEITNIGGNITRKDGQPYLHLHITIGDPMSGICVGGHLTRAVISATAEIIVTTISGNVDREYSADIGLNIFKFQG